MIKQFYQIGMGLALGLVLFACDQEQAQRDPEEFARARQSREVRRITEVEVVESAYAQGQAVRDGISFELPKITARPSAQFFVAYETAIPDSLPEKVVGVLASYQYQYEQDQTADDNVQSLGDSLVVYTWPTDSGVHTLYYPRSEIVLAIP